MKPSWNDAPPWANWLAMDENGVWYWHEKKPVIHGFFWMSENGRSVPVEQLNNWHESLEGRKK